MIMQVRPGVLPFILAALMTARSTTRVALKAAGSAEARAVLDGRQKALKLVANALYGFTGEWWSIVYWRDQVCISMME